MDVALVLGQSRLGPFKGLNLVHLTADHPRNEDAPHGGSSDVGGLQPAAGGPLEQFDLWRATTRSLRGRHGFASALVLAGLALGAAAGGLLGKRLYSATGIVRIASDLPHVMHETDQNRAISNFDGYMMAQRDIMASPEIIEQAMKSPLWAASHATPPTAEQFANGLKVESRPKSDHLKVTFTDKDPGVGSLAVRSAIEAFQQAFVRQEEHVEKQRMGQLTERRQSLGAELQGVQTEINAVAQGRSASDVEPLSSAANERVRKFKSMLADVQCALAGGPDLTPRAAATPKSPAETTLEERLRFWSSEQSRAELTIAQCRAQGAGDKHPILVRATALSRECARQIESYKKELDACRTPGSATAAPTLAEREATLTALVQAADDEAKALGAQRTRLRSLEERAGAIRASLIETDARIDALSTEAALSGRLSVVQAGDRPMTAVLDNRTKYAALGAISGAATPLVCLVLMGSVRRRYRFSDELAADLSGHTPFVTSLPSLGDTGPLLAVAVHRVHDLHVRLQPQPGAGGRVYLVSSPAAREGKTSLALALGLSLANSGVRTLLVDADLTTRRLTRGFECDDKPGLVETAEGGELAIRSLRCGLAVLPVGRCQPRDAWRLSPASSHKALESVRERFDVVLIDADPVLTGIRASVLAPQTDGVILAVAHGQEQKLVERTTRHLRLLGAPLAGVVLNRADGQEFHAELREQPHSPAVGYRRIPEKLARFGPLVSAILSSLSLSRESDLDLMPNQPTLARTDPVAAAA